MNQNVSTAGGSDTREPAGPALPLCPYFPTQFCLPSLRPHSIVGKAGGELGVLSSRQFGLSLPPKSGRLDFPGAKGFQERNTSQDDQTGPCASQPLVGSTLNRVPLGLPNQARSSRGVDRDNRHVGFRTRIELRNHIGMGKEVPSVRWVLVRPKSFFAPSESITPTLESQG